MVLPKSLCTVLWGYIRVLILTFYLSCPQESTCSKTFILSNIAGGVCAIQAETFVQLVFAAVTSNILLSLGCTFSQTRIIKVSVLVLSSQRLILCTIIWLILPVSSKTTLCEHPAQRQLTRWRYKPWERLTLQVWLWGLAGQILIVHIWQDLYAVLLFVRDTSASVVNLLCIENRCFTG